MVRFQALGLCCLALILTTFVASGCHNSSSSPAVEASGQQANTANPRVEFLKQQASTLMEADKESEAVPLYEKLVKLAPNDAEVHKNLGLVFCDTGLYDAALPE